VITPTLMTHASRSAVVTSLRSLADGYRLHGSPAATFDGRNVIVAQAVVLADE
jgi:hypothetical protein